MAAGVHGQTRFLGKSKSRGEHHEVISLFLQNESECSHLNEPRTKIVVALNSLRNQVMCLETLRFEISNNGQVANCFWFGFAPVSFPLALCVTLCIQNGALLVLKQILDLRRSGATDIIVDLRHMLMRERTVYTVLD